MSKKPFQPSPPADVSVRSEGSLVTLVFVRELNHPPERVWSALTDPVDLRAWAPFDVDGDLGVVGPATLAMAGGTGEMKQASTVRRADRPKLLEYDWGGDLLRWEIEPTATGSRLTLFHTQKSRAWIPRVAAGWHLCLDVADRFMSGDPVGRIVGASSREHGWVEVNDAYADRLGIPSKGWPTEAEIKEKIASASR